jgi:hypothetical protein
MKSGPKLNEGVWNPGCIARQNRPRGFERMVTMASI